MTSIKTTKQAAPALTKKRRPTQSEIMHRIRASREAALKLTAIGHRVIVIRDNGDEFSTTIKDLPWELGHGGWVVGVEGLSGGYCTTRVRPAIGGGL